MMTTANASAPAAQAAASLARHSGFSGWRLRDAARSVPVGANVAVADGDCTCALACVQVAANAVVAPATASLRVHMV